MALESTSTRSPTLPSVVMRAARSSSVSTHVSPSPSTTGATPATGVPASPTTAGSPIVPSAAMVRTLTSVDGGEQPTASEHAGGVLVQLDHRGGVRAVGDDDGGAVAGQHREPSVGPPEAQVVRNRVSEFGLRLDETGDAVGQHERSVGAPRHGQPGPPVDLLGHDAVGWVGQRRHDERPGDEGEDGPHRRPQARPCDHPSACGQGRHEAIVPALDIAPTLPVGHLGAIRATQQSARIVPDSDTIRAQI